MAVRCPHDYATEGIDRKCCAAGALGFPGMSGAVMVIPGHAVLTGVFGASDCSARTAADSWPHPGLVELLNVVNSTPRGRRGLSWLVFGVGRSVRCRNADHAVDVLGELRQLCYPHQTVQSGTRYPSTGLGDIAAAHPPRDDFSDQEYRRWQFWIACWKRRPEERDLAPESVDHRQRWQALQRGPPQTGFGGLVPIGVASEVLRISAGSGRVQLSAAELEECWLRGPYVPVLVCASRSP
jgi:hypothetical protein